MVLATDMKFLGKGTPAGQKVGENADVKRRACVVSTSIKDYLDVVLLTYLPLKFECE